MLFKFRNIGFNVFSLFIFKPLRILRPFLVFFFLSYLIIRLRFKLIEAAKSEPSPTLHPMYEHFFIRLLFPPSILWIPMNSRTASSSPSFQSPPCTLLSASLTYGGRSEYHHTGSLTVGLTPL